MKNILFYEPAKPVGRNGVGGSLVSLLHLVQMLDSRFYRPVIFLHHRFDIIDEYEASGCKVILEESRPQSKTKHKSRLRKALRNAPGKRFLREMKLVVANQTMIFNLCRVIKKENIDVVHCNAKIEMGFAAVIASLLTRTPCICHNRSYIGDISIIFKFLAKSISRHIAISISIRDALIKKGLSPRKIFLIHNWISVEKNPPIQKHTMNFKADDVLKILSVGRIIPWKGQHILVDVANDLKNKQIPFRIHIFGYFDENEDYFLSIKKRINNLKLEQFIFMEGYKPYEYIYSHVYDLSIHTSVEPEPFGRVIIEAMYNRIPVIASGLGGTLDIIEEGVNGLLFDPSRPRDLTDKIMRLVEDKELRNNLVDRGIATVMGNFSGSEGIQQITSLYEDLVRPKSP